MGVDQRILQSGDRQQVSDRVSAIFQNRRVPLQGGTTTEDPSTRISRITNDIMGGSRSFDDIRGSVDRLSGLGNQGRDRSIVQSGDRDSVADRIAAIFENRNVRVGTPDERESTRLNRITDQVMDGRTLDDVRWSVDRIARTSPTQDYPTEPAALSAEQVAVLDARRQAALGGFREALTNQEAGIQAADAQRAAALSRLGSEIDTSRFEGLSEFGARGMARNPRQAGRLGRQLDTAREQQTGDIDLQRAERLQALEQMVQAARRQKVDENRRADADEALWTTDAQRLFQPTAGGMA